MTSKTDSPLYWPSPLRCVDSVLMTSGPKLSSLPFGLSASVFIETGRMAKKEMENRCKRAEKKIKQYDIHIQT